jgi:signal transduction histidine kinase
VADPVAGPLLDELSQELQVALAELRDLARGIHPAILTDFGLQTALEGLADRAPVPVALRVDLAERLPPSLEAAAYFIAAEALTNVAKYARASKASVSVSWEDEQLLVEIADDGVGGAEPAGGSGLRGLADRVEAIGGTLAVASPPGHGTRVRAHFAGRAG